MRKKRITRSILAAALAAGLVLPVPASAAVWNFYGSSRVSSFVTDTDNVGATPDTETLALGLHGNARIGAKVRVSDTLAGRFEYGSGVNIRHLFGEWNFGPGKLLVGQTLSPLNILPSTRVYRGDEGMFNYGASYAGRQPMVRLTFGDFQIAALTPGTDTLGLAGSVTEVSLPKIEVRYEIGFDSGYLRFAGGYNGYELKDTATNITHDVDSWVGSVGGKFSYQKAFFGANVWVGQNTGPYNFRCASDDMPVISGSDLIDNEGYGFLLVAGYKLNDRFSFEAGYGFVAAEPDSSAFSEDETEAWYVQTKVTLARGVFFIPEIGIIDNRQDNTGADESEIFYYGMKWQINF